MRPPEFGSEFHMELEALQAHEAENDLFSLLGAYNACYTDSGRSALRLLQAQRHFRRVLVPAYLCASAWEGLAPAEIDFYPLDDCLHADGAALLRKAEKADAIYLCHYFGFLQPPQTLAALAALKRERGLTIIEDTTHSLFTRAQTVGDYCIASLRKWFPVPDGGVLYALATLGEAAFTRAPAVDKAYGMMLKTLYLRGELDCNDEYRRIFAQSEQALDASRGAAPLSALSRFMLARLDVPAMIARRRENYAVLRRGVSALGIRCLTPEAGTECPFVLPVLLENRDECRRYLIENGVYCAVHWPLAHTPLAHNASAREMAEHILSLPIDQRYDADGMGILLERLEGMVRACCN